MTKACLRLRRHGIAALAITFLVSIASIAHANSLDSAKSAGYVGEMRNGMLGLVDSNAPADVKALVESVNAKRKSAYTAIAKKNGTSLSSVAALAGEKAISMTSPGNYIQNAGGGWEKK
jgi:uncharacterized protein YdbL (DUF1318 family)